MNFLCWDQFRSPIFYFSNPTVQFGHHLSANFLVGHIVVLDSIAINCVAKVAILRITNSKLHFNLVVQFQTRSKRRPKAKLNAFAPKFNLLNPVSAIHGHSTLAKAVQMYRQTFPARKFILPIELDPSFTVIDVLTGR